MLRINCGWGVGKYFLKRLFCDHDWVTTDDYWYVNEFSVGHLLERIVKCSKCNKRKVEMI